MILARLLSRLGDGVAVVSGRLRARWHSSLQVRVVTTTLVVSALVVTVLGFFLMQEIAAGQLASKLHSATDQAEDGLGNVQGQGGLYSNLSPNTSALMRSIVSELAPKSGSGSDYGVAVTLPGDLQGPPVYNGGWAIGIENGLVPARLVKAVELERKKKNSTPIVETATLRYGSPPRPVAGLAFGAPLGNYYQLYYFFPLTQEQQILALDQRTILFVGIALVFLLAAIASLLTRWVVVPVRQAAQAARRLSTGNLDDRVAVRGTDDLAGLATSFNEMAASLKEKMAELEGLSQVQRQFVSDVSHELRTPLTTIRIAADVLFAGKDGMNSAAGRSAELLQSQLERFESLLVDLLEISRYDANAATLDAEPVDICEIVRHSADVAQQLAERRGAKIEFRLPAEPCVAEADGRRVARILRNLLVNAVEHGENRDAVVTVASDRDAVAVAVRDYGVGLAPGEEHLVFDRFWRADPARARTTGGTGLGLSIALEDARLHGGWLEAWGEPGRGSVFRLTLPRTQGGRLAGSPLPLCPDEADRDAVTAAPSAASVPVDSARTPSAKPFPAAPDMARDDADDAIPAGASAGAEGAAADEAASSGAAARG
jgi:two-component system sensor histidine kinase MtrB